MEITSISLLVSIMLISALSLPNWPSFTDIMKVFASEAPVTIIAMFMVSAALTRHRLIEGLSKYLESFTKMGYKPFMLILLLTIAFFLGLCEQYTSSGHFITSCHKPLPLGVSSSKMLIPISYASIFGGCCTLLGTSTNILASGIMSESALYPQMSAMGMFELAKIGLPLLLGGLFFLVIFGQKLLPHREALSSIISSIERKEFLTEAIIPQNSSLLGCRLEESPLSSLTGVRLLDVVRKDRSLAPAMNSLEFQVGDRLILTCKPHGLLHAREEAGIEFFNSLSIEADSVSVDESLMVEGMISPSSSLIGKRLIDANFRSNYNLAVVAVHRKGKPSIKVAKP